MPDDRERPAEGRTGLLEPVEYTPCVQYRGNVLWHHLSDAHEIAASFARTRGFRHRVTGHRVPGHDHLLWRVSGAGDER